MDIFQRFSPDNSYQLCNKMEKNLVEIDVTGVAPLDGPISKNYLFSIGIIPCNNVTPQVGVIQGTGCETYPDKQQG